MCLECGEMKAINIQEDRYQYFHNIMNQFGNTDEFLCFFQEFQEDISYENIIERTQRKAELNVNLEEEISFLSSNFHGFNSKYPDLIFTLEWISSNEKFKLLNEEESFYIILVFYIKSNEYSTLFSQVIFMNLS